MRNIHKRRFEKVDANQPAIVEALRAAGCSVEVIGKPLDLLVCWRGVTWLMEVKSEDGALTDEQQKFLQRWPGRVSIVRDVGDALRRLIENP